MTDDIAALKERIARLESFPREIVDKAVKGECRVPQWILVDAAALVGADLDLTREPEE